MALIECPECGQKISDKTKLCVHCGVSLKLCAECGKAVIADAEVCPSCGVEFGKAPAQESVPENTEKTKEEVKAEQDGLREISSLKAKWAQQDAVMAKINSALAILSFVGGGILLIVLVIWIFTSIYEVETNGGSFNFWKVMSNFVRFTWILFGLDFIKESAAKIGALVIEHQRSKDLQELGREKYFYYLKKNSLKAEYEDELGFYNDVETAAMPLEVSKEKGKRTFSKVWSLVIHVVSFVYLLIFISVFAVNAYEGNSSVLGIFGILFDEMLQMTLFGLMLLVCWIYSLVLESKTKKRQDAWRRSLQNAQ